MMRSSMSLIALSMLSACAGLEFDDRKRTSSAERAAECQRQGHAPDTAAFEDCLAAQGGNIDWDSSAVLYEHMQSAPSARQIQCHSAGKKTQCLRF